MKESYQWVCVMYMMLFSAAIAGFVAGNDYGAISNLTCAGMAFLLAGYARRAGK